MKFIRSIPMFAYLLIFYNVFLLQGAGDAHLKILAQAILVIPLQKATITANLGDVLVMVGVGALYIELFKATRSTNASIFDHMLSMMVFVVFLVELLMVSATGTVTFLTLTLMSFLDVVAGFTVTISSARRDFTQD
ncbi:MAG: hypothetical protein HQL63_08610 [Magnetococcales bacterium]|nr:hypothetical protein [Magnetococcales bacterium]MBF0322159.1 hypothetical protein [Magnetococcales bacterium]